MSINQESHDGDRLARATLSMQAIDAGDLPVGLSVRTRAAVTRAAQRRRRAVGMRLVAAAVVGALGLAAFFTQSHSSVAFAELAARVNATRTLKAVVVDPREGGTLLVSGTRTRFEGNGAAVIADASQRQEVMLDSRTLSAYRIPQRGLSQALDFYGIFRDLADAASTPIPGYTDKLGRLCPGAQGRADVKIAGNATWSVDAKVWSDPVTKLPTRMEIRPLQESTAIVLEEIEFDVPLDEALFDLTIPPGYQVVGLSADQLKAAPGAEEAAKLTITAGVGIGDIKFGMSRQQIVAILGEPEFTLHEVYLNYASKGLQLVLVGREPNKLGMIIANPYDAASLTRHEFPGQTDKGIQIGSSEQEVTDAYGQPDPRRPNIPAHLHYAAYENLGLSIGFLDGKVSQITASRTD